MVVSIALPRLAANSDEAALIQYHLARLEGLKAKNKVKAAYYEGKQRVRLLGITIPPSMREIETVAGWPGSTVDVIEERLDWLGWTSESGDDPFGLDEVFVENSLDVDSGLGHLDALIYGTAFVAVGAGFDGEPSPLITVESPLTMTGEWDGRLRRLSSALSIDEKETRHGRVTKVTLYLPDKNITYSRGSGRDWRVEELDDHGLGRVTVAQLVNRPRASRVGGRSEITRAIRSYTDQGVRALLGMAVNSEFYSAPQRYLLGGDEGAFTDKDGNVKTGWEAVIGSMLAIPLDEDGNKPEIGQFSASSPQPYLDQVRGLAQLVAAEAGIPANYLGFVSDNPASADAIRAGEARLIKRAERRQAVFGRTWREVGRLGLLVRDGSVPADFSKVGVKWQDAATPTRSAASDEATKLIGAGVLTPDSSVTYDRVGLSPQEQKRLDEDKRKARAAQRTSSLTEAASAVRQMDARMSAIEANTATTPTPEATNGDVPTGR